MATIEVFVFENPEHEGSRWVCTNLCYDHVTRDEKNAAAKRALLPRKTGPVVASDPCCCVNGYTSSVCPVHASKKEEEK
jgi:hypothetical protein